MYKSKFLFLMLSCCVLLIGCESNSNEDYDSDYSVETYEEDYEDYEDYEDDYEYEEEYSYEYSEDDYGTDFDSTWGDLMDANGGELVYGTLSAEQQELVNYPYLDEECVFFVPDGSSYHSVDWCYTLSRSNNIFSCTLQEAIDSNLDSCSKCVE